MGRTNAGWLDPALFEAFPKALPKTTYAAARIAQGHDQRLRGRESLEPAASHRMRHAVEVRHDSFVTPTFIAMLRKHRIDWVVADTPRPWPRYEDVTADFICMRLHAWTTGGQPADARLIASEPPPERASRDVYRYFDNIDKLHAPNNARELMEKPGLQRLPPASRPIGIPR